MLKAPINKIQAEEVLDSRGNPTVRARVFAGDSVGEFAVPSGASAGQHEALELRDGDQKRFNGLGVKKAVHHVEKVIFPAVRGLNVFDQRGLDTLMVDLDGTPNKSRLGANAILAVSIASAKAAAAHAKQEMFHYLPSLAEIKPSHRVPYLFINLINGGKHASGALAFQEYHIVPMVNDIEEALQIGHAVQSELRTALVKKYGPLSANIGDEGGFVPDMTSVAEPFQMFEKVVEKLKYTGKVKFSMDVAADSFYMNGKYRVDGKLISKSELFDLYKNLVKRFPIFSIEDPFQEEDMAGFGELLALKKFHVVGDDLTVTNSARIQWAIDSGSIDAVIIKPNQIGTLTETLDAMKLARNSGLQCIVSHRSGETTDDFIADLAFAFGCYGIKAGGLQRGERLVKYNRLQYISNL